ncbi:MAG: NADH-quinone oxidoreductase subunit L, partial [Alphaproteobacteria bacterium]|nr:NADH-quinone oxidoreductase subunit L [Alphaproteobacteria bacterium]
MVTAVIFLPLIGALISGLFVRRISPHFAQMVTCGCMLVSALLAALVFKQVALDGEMEKVVLANWIESGSFNAMWTLRVDVLTAVMLIVVTWVSSVVHLYSVGYMHHDPHQQRFMCYLSLFTFFMLMLVTADNLLQLFLGWEGVGLCSYLLIGFWFHKSSANAAAMKAFIVNRVGDFGFALGIFATYLLFDTIQFDAIFDQIPLYTSTTIEFLGYQIHALTLICVLLFIGCMGKSAQIGLHTWLPDAMEGPTPVSALIHAATMVTAGVFLVVRMSPMFETSQFALNMITIVGATTAFFAATVALTQTDIKKVIAYSTCSQLGYMFFACGVGAYSAAIFHLMTHAFFKALLFLSAGSVIHAVSDEQDMRNMGGLRKHIPITYAFMWIGSLALAGLPWFAGYYSKDIILESAYAAHSAVGTYAFWMGIAAATLTAFYSWRLLFMTFHGKPRASEEVMSHVHESPKIMWMPLLLLAAGALFSGALGYYWLGMVDPSLAFWNGTVGQLGDNVLEHAHHVPLWVVLLPLIVGVLGISGAYIAYVKNPSIPGKAAAKFPRIYQFLVHKWYFDEMYDFLFVRGAKALGRHFWKFWDVRVIDGLGPNGAAWMSGRLAAFASRVQTGYLYHYAFA